MKKIIFSCLILFLICGCASTKEVVIKNWTGVAEKPSWNIGERWIYTEKDSKGLYRKSNIIIEYLGMEEKDGTTYHVFFNRGTGRKRYFTKDFHWALSSEKNPVGPGWRDYECFDPPDKLFDFPLQVGKSWQYNLITSRIEGIPPKPRTGKCVKERKVVDYVRIEIEGKSYDAFKIEEKCQLHATQQALWYAPSVKNWVKRSVYQKDGSWWQEELKSYEPK